MSKNDLNILTPPHQSHGDYGIYNPANGWTDLTGKDVVIFMDYLGEALVQTGYAKDKPTEIWSRLKMAATGLWGPWERLSVTRSGLTVVAPQDGETVPPVHDVIGLGAAPGATVELWSADRDPATATPNATTTAESDGSWGFTGDTPAVGSEVEWYVRSGGEESNHVHVQLSA